VELTFDPKPPMRYAFVPTQPIMRLLLINGVDVLYHESTFTIRRSSSRKDDAFNSKRGGHNSFESKGKTLDTRHYSTVMRISVF
jgi:hypothetical protein